jgi:hypothetical protein
MFRNINDDSLRLAQKLVSAILAETADTQSPMAFAMRD